MEHGNLDLGLSLGLLVSQNSLSSTTSSHWSSAVEEVCSGRGKRTEREEAAAAPAVAARPASSDEEDNEANGRKKLRLSKDQAAVLEECFKTHSTLNPKQKMALAKQLGLRARQVEVWFQNRRARTKLKQTEVDCEHLKRWCERLAEENRRLEMELAELRSTRVVPAAAPLAALTMCPSCRRVSAAAPAASGMRCGGSANASSASGMMLARTPAAVEMVNAGAPRATRELF